MLGQHLLNVLSATNQATDLAIVYLGRLYTWLNGNKRKKTRFVVSQMEMEMEMESMKKITRMMMRDTIMW